LSSLSSPLPTAQRKISFNLILEKKLHPTAAKITENKIAINLRRAIFDKDIDKSPVSSSFLMAHGVRNLVSK